MHTQNADQSQLFIQLLIGSGIVSRQELMDFKKIARDLNMPIVQAIMGSGSVDKRVLSLAGEVMIRIQSKQFSLDFGIRALSTAVQRNIGITEAINSVKNMYVITRVDLAVTNELTNLLLDANVITREQLGRLLVKSHESSIMIGQVMILENVISVNGLIAALNTVMLLRDSVINQQQAVDGLQSAYSRNLTIEQALFELGSFSQHEPKMLTLAELFLMARLITIYQYIECLEVEMFKKKEFDHVLLERGVITKEQLDVALNLVTSTKSGKILLPYEAARALRMVLTEGKNLYATVTEFVEGRERLGDLRLGDLLVLAGVCEQEQIESSITRDPNSAVKVGTALLKAKLISERLLYSALRLHSCVRLGYMSREDAVSVLHASWQNKVTLEQAMTDAKIYVPSRMQWSWV